jgi:hypothetical protein
VWTPRYAKFLGVDRCHLSGSSYPHEKSIAGFQDQSDHSGNFAAQIEHMKARLYAGASPRMVAQAILPTTQRFFWLRDLSGSNITSLVISLTSASNNSDTDLAFAALAG